MSDPVRCPKDMVYIPAGTFEMGSTKGGWYERPSHDVYVSSFCMDKHEVTNAQFGFSRSPEGFDGSDQPVVNVDWYEADAFCKSQGKRLPTEAEWEKAARGPEGYEYGTRSGVLSRNEAHYDVDATSNVCSYPENAYSVYDMTGNVSEWVSNWYDADSYETMESINPEGPADGSYKVLRGGNWNSDDPKYLRAVYLLSFHPDFYLPDIGFRCAADPLNETVPSKVPEENHWDSFFDALAYGSVAVFYKPE